MHDGYVNPRRSAAHGSDERRPPACAGAIWRGIPWQYFAAAIVFIACMAIVLGDEIELQNGKKISGTIESRTENQVTIKVDTAKFTFKLKDVLRINGQFVSKEVEDKYKADQKEKRFKLFMEERKAELASIPANTQNAISNALDWLKRHQAENGSWGSNDFHKQCKGSPACTGAGCHNAHTQGLTGLALLAFAEGGALSLDGRYSDTIKKGMDCILGMQNEDGSYGAKLGDGNISGSFLYCHYLCTAALARVYRARELWKGYEEFKVGIALTEDEAGKLRKSIEKAVKFIIECQNPYLGWRYGKMPGDNDTSCTSFACLALFHAREFVLIPREVRDGVTNWISKVTPDDLDEYYAGYGLSANRKFIGYTTTWGTSSQPKSRTGPDVLTTCEHLMRGLRDRPYVFPFKSFCSTTAAGLFCSIFSQGDKARLFISKATPVLDQAPPVWDTKDPSFSFVYWFFGSLVAKHSSSLAWKEQWKWKSELTKVLQEKQIMGAECRRGSWDPDDLWGVIGGRVYSTALAALCLESGIR